ncbi:zinc-dependent alcohol dehydrogenase family protein [Cedecea neteri]|uniref:zinc-dependent alcohol dehydrogenase family protein n=1 Tax=Cedecea neteri TaxID=158822 RepID=UPI00155EBAFE|nr:zinc-binding dehydrogenase [Cedecea neteri]NIG77675.1 zinc-dependent alcohol dehydrogenase family protein [Klebsiella sp. Ap-873]WNJ81762.1 zinc-dependent alcohol dehydrogenase family protein [Cedecea neteri]
MENTALWFRQFGEPEQVLTLEQAPLAPFISGTLRVRMHYAPLNPSDLIPITGAYRHRVFPPRIAGYEGVGIVELADHPAWIGKRVLPLRGEGTWQRWVDCPVQWAVAVPDNVPDELAARGYINPLAAWLMLKRWPVAGKRVLVTAAGSTCAGLLAQWAKRQGATEVYGVYRSAQHLPALLKSGVIPLNMDDGRGIAEAAGRVDVVYDAVGGELATLMLDHLNPNGALISYGLLSGKAFSPRGKYITAQRFHLRDTLAVTPVEEWQGWFESLWELLIKTQQPDVAVYSLEEWRQALELFREPGRQRKPLLRL